MRHALFVLLSLVLVIAYPSAAQEPSDGCSIDLTDVTDLLQEAQSALDARNTAQTVTRLRRAHEALGALIEACEQSDGLPLDETTILRGALPDGDIILSYPQGWQVELGESELTLVEDAPEATAITGVLTAFPLESLEAFNLTADADTASMLENLALRMAGSMDDSALEPATADGEIAVLDGTVTEDGATLRVTFAAARFETGLAFLFLASPAADADVMAYAEAIISALEFVPD